MAGARVPGSAVVATAAAVAGAQVHGSAAAAAVAGARIPGPVAVAGAAVGPRSPR